MAKDILVNTNTGDLITSQYDLKTTYWEVVWGKLFDTDNGEYMNIVIPRWYVGRVRYEDNTYECQVHAAYYPVDQSFQVRFVVSNGSGYDDASALDNKVPAPTTAVYYPPETVRAAELLASQLPLLNVNGHFKVSFKRYKNSDFTRAIIYQSENSDFEIGESDNQSAQLLARCAPGSYYRFPGIGVDLTKYINSVVDHTDLTESLVEEFASDYKSVTSAEFDNSTGDLLVDFNGTREAADTDLIDPDKLDLELLRIADDEYIRTLYQTGRAENADNEFDLKNFLSYSHFLGLYDIGCNCKLGKTASSVVSHGYLTKDGKISNGVETGLASMQVEAGKLYALNYNFSSNNEICQMHAYVNDFDENGYAHRHSYYTHNPLFALSDAEGNVMHADFYFYCDNVDERRRYGWAYGNRRLFIPKEDMTLNFTVGSKYSTGASLNTNGYREGIYLVEDTPGNYTSVLGIALDTVRGKLFGIVTEGSLIEDVKIDIKTNKLFIIKRNTR